MNKIGLSTSSVYPGTVEDTFRLAKDAGYDGIEVMISQNPITRSIPELKKLTKKYDLPILSIHAPVLVLTHFVWGRDPKQKLYLSAKFAEELGASTVVVHPPFSWQKEYATEFLNAVNEFSKITGVEIAVENMFPWKVRNRTINAYAPSWEQITLHSKAITLDFSHAALAGKNSLEMARKLGKKLRHIHLCDGATNTGTKDKIFDQHLAPGYGTQPVAETLNYLANKNWDGHVVAEVNTRKYRSHPERLRVLTETRLFAERNLEHGLN